MIDLSTASHSFLRGAARAVLALLGVVGVLAACGDDVDDRLDTTTTTGSDGAVASTSLSSTTSTTEPSGDPASTVDPCAFFGDDDLAGFDIVNDIRTPDEFNGIFPGCRYGTPPGAVAVYLEVGEGWFGDDEHEHVSDIGEDAYYDEDWHRLFVMTADNQIFFVQVPNTSDDELNQLRSLAEAVIDQIS